MCSLVSVDGPQVPVRRVPADQMLWLVLGMALFRDKPVHKVARRLNICVQGLASDHLLARSGVSEAHKWLGADPVEWLFRKTGTLWAGAMTMTPGRVCRCLPWTVRFCAPRILPNYGITSA